EPHPLCLLAAKELQQHLNTQTQWQHNFGLGDDQDNIIGKMFGVLVVQNEQNEIGYLSAFSGKLAGSNHLKKFVPPVFDLLQKESFFLSEQAEINQLTTQLNILEKNPNIEKYHTILNAEIKASTQHISAKRIQIIEARKNRKRQRQAAEKDLESHQFLQLKEQLSKESIDAKKQLKELTSYWNKRIEYAQDQLNLLIDPLSDLKQHRKKRSAALQKKIFQQYQFFNIKGDQKSLHHIFIETSQKIPPAGAGECAAPKLLHYAFQWKMKPLAMAEFWWGASPKSEIRQHKNFYAACHGKCKPILKHMLEGMSVDDNPLLINPAQEKIIRIIYEDDVLLVIHKPEDLLSVPGKSIKDSVYQRIKQEYPQATGPLIVHRLDMSTSGLMLIALNKDTHKHLQKQFIKRTIKKRYTALLDGLIKEDKGFIDLPLRVDLEDRPRQLVCYEHGKPAKTQWQVIERKNMKTKVYFYPITGRTHQLRVHAAHVKGLGIPIVGDDLYGTKANRLHLHADFLEFQHPISGQSVYFESPTDF
ncbi:MAG: RNA pseudouridine synthase, partial [Gammaproteobacteria bacterium]|nr:RNA pseudouridine synthase [Gammaproteobacteria bacterium]